MTKKGTWRQQLDRLERNVGHGTLHGEFYVDQRYAAYQHVHKHLRHPRGGGPDYVSIPLRAEHKEWYRGIAAGLLDGSAPDKMADAMDQLNDAIKFYAPVDENDLRRSGGYTVRDGAQVHTRKAPEQRRLTDAQLRAKSARRWEKGPDAK